MANKPRAYVTALPLSALPDLQDLLAPFFAAKGQPRDNVVMVRLGDEAVAKLDDLVEAGIFGSRSEAAAFLVGAGIHAQSGFFERIAAQASEIKRLRDSLRLAAREVLSANMSPLGPPPEPEKPKKTRKSKNAGVRA
jgi:hypothetical protein